MAITTVTYDVLTDSGITYESIGLSDTLDNYTLDEILDYTYCGEYDVLKRNVMINSPNTRLEAPSLLDNLNIPITYTSSNPLHWEAGQGDYTNPDGLFGRILWLKTEGTYVDVITEDNANDYKLITSWTATKYYFTIPTLKQGWITASRAATSWNDNKTYPCLYWTGNDKGALKFHSKYGQAGDVEFSLSYQPYIIAEAREGSYILYNLNQGENIHTWYGARNVSIYGSPDNFADGNLISFDKAATYSIVYAAREWFGDAGTDKDLRDYPAGNELPFNWNMGRFNELQLSQTVVGDQYLMFCSSGGSQYNAYAGIRYWTYPSVKHDSLLFWANAGVFFIADSTVYKPIISNNIVTGYSDDLSTESDYDNYDGKTKHDSSPTPPGPGPGPYDDDPWSGATFAGTGVGGAGAFAKVYYMTSTELANLRSWMNSINVPEGFDPMQQIIGLSQVPVALSGSGPENVVFVNSSAVYDPGVTTRAVDTGVATQQAMGTPISYYLGSVDIVRRMQERGEPYLDYDCQIELYLPLIGMFSLDTQAVMGRTISAYAVLDPVSGTLAAYAYVTKDGQNLPIAYGSTTIGVDLPISAQQLSVSRAALKQANAQLSASLLSGALTMFAAASSSGKSSGSGAKTSTGSSGLSAAGIREAGSDYMKASQVGNVFGDFMNWGRTIRQLSYGNNTAIAGSFGGSTAQWAYPFTPYVKIIRPRYEKPSNYNHSQGVPCVQTKTIGSCTGFIQCIGADVSGITGATDLELQAIQAALSNGIYAGGGQ